MGWAARATCWAALLWATPAAAQLGASTGTGNNLNIEHYHPEPLGYSSLDGTESQQWREWTLGLYLHYARNPLVLFAERLQVGEVVGHRFSQDLVASVGILRWLEAGVTLPVTYYQRGDPDLPTGALAQLGLRDLRLRVKLTLARQDQTGLLGIAFVPEVGLPTGDATAFLGDGSVVFAPQLLVDRSLALLWGLRAGAALGLRVRPRAEIGNIEIDDELFYRLGVGVGLPDFSENRSELVAELAGVSRLDAPFSQAEQNAVLGTLALRMSFELKPGHRLLGTGGFTVGATRGYGSPDFQVFLGAAYQRWLSDRDGDQIYDDDDACPDDPEDRDQFEDQDGCPEPDNDKDGIPDVADRCRDVAEDKDHFQDLDGCPEPDNDRDGIPDLSDRCKNDPEDFDGFEDADGCPEPDNDRDGVPDALDRCREAKETINGVDDEDGCPDEGQQHVEVTAEKVTIDSRINFDFDSARIRPDSFSILNQVALTLLANLQLEKIRVEGHTDDRGGEDYNLILSQRRAESVMQYLIGRGVAAERLEAVGYGESRPLVSGRDEEAWARNRRVEFTILEQGSVESGGRRLEVP